MRIKSVIISILLLTTLLVSSFVINVGANSLDVTVSVNSPDIVEIGNNFNVTINISYVEGFDAANFDVTYNPEIINITQVSGGKINNTNLPCAWDFTGYGKILVIINLPGLTGVTGEGYLAKIQFETISTGTSNINLSNGVLANNTVKEIPAEWNNNTVEIQGSAHTLTLNIYGQGSVIKNPDKTYYLLGTQVQLTANPSSGWSFEKWEGDITGSTNPYTLIIDENKTINATFTKNSNGDSGSPPPAQPPVNNEVVANASESETFGYAGIPITFDSSRSTGNINSYEWDFGDGQTDSGEIVTHIYAAENTYTVKLTVSGSSSSDTEIFDVVITSIPNTPPTKPVLTGINSGNVNIEYSYTAISFDDDKDSLRYVLDWGDGETITTELLTQGQEVTQKHTWTSPGIYVIKIKANDNKTDSKTLEYTVSIDTVIVEDIGYLTDDNSDGIYDTFHGSDAETNVEKQTNGTYLIDSDADDTYDKLFDPITMQLSSYTQSQKQKEPIISIPVEFVIIGLIVAIFFCLIVYLLKNRSRKDLEKNDSNFDNKNRVNEIISKHENKKEEAPNQNNIPVRCPRCKEILNIAKSNLTERIKCPKCGETGIIKYDK